MRSIFIMTVYTLKNDIITAKISEIGAEVISVVRGEDGCEYMWQGDPKYWDGQAPYLFPICGRFFGNVYSYCGKDYEMGMHGFASTSPFELVDASDTHVTLSLKANEETKACYPFDFELVIKHSLVGEMLSVDVAIKNRGDVVLPAAFGAHPGFNVPLGGVGAFEDYRLEFSEDCSPDELIITSDGFYAGRNRAFPIRESRYIDLRHSLFDIEAVFMENAAREVKLCSDLTKRGVTFRYPDMPYFGIWHEPLLDAPHICLEPWYGLPGYQGVKDDISTKNNMYRIEPRSEKKIRMELLFH